MQYNEIKGSILAIYNPIEQVSSMIEANEILSEFPTVGIPAKKSSIKLGTGLKLKLSLEPETQ